MTDDPPILDGAVLAELRESVGDDEEFIADLVETYLRESRDHLSAMEQATESNDAGAIVRPAHTLKSSSAALGAMRLAQVAREIEMAGRAGDSTDLVQRVRDARAAFDDALREMTSAGLAK